MRIVLIHGAATTARIWDAVASRLDGHDVVVPERPCTGRLDDELAFLEPWCTDALVAGVSGGATLGLAMAARGVPFAGAVLHEPAAGSLVPGLLDAVAAAYRDGGVEGFGRTLYGPAWSPADAPADPDAVGRDLAMFRAFEPSLLLSDNVLLTAGAASPPVRHEVHRALLAVTGAAGHVIDGARHAVHLEAPAVFASLLSERARPQGR